MVFTSVGVICSNALIFDYGMNTGGPVMLTWGWIIGSVFTMFTALSLAEITSTYPVSGSTYHWAGLLAKREHAGIASFICGWFSFLGNAATDASFAYGFAEIVGAIIELKTGGKTSLSNGVKVAIAIGCMFSFAIKNIAKMDAQGWFNNASAIFQMGSTFILILAIVIAAPERSSSEFVWTKYYNSTGMPSVAYVCIIGILTTLYGMSGYEAAS
jgi:amino acid transporter